ncbi:DNA primase [Streptomyces sp. A7024]|uniref:DNA primase n=1 Tax=Streptomyces coryli TaxID=1128680 RepID=A0A6G4TWR6_9ACTN|nr:bifunctional DNA primase/polymerase [Streptomyces coryli]NGN63886.1 DNA primase [Streptomyces coryli]
MPHPEVERQLRAALDAARRGWHVFPVAAGDKPPAIAAWEAHATTDRQRIHETWHSRLYNIGIAAGPSGLVVVDLDVPKDPADVPPQEWRQRGVRDGMDTFAALCERHGQPFPDSTYSVRTRAGGMHLYFTAPPGRRIPNTVEKHGWKVDTRARGGYVLGAGSVVEGRPYELVVDAPAAPLPDWLAQLLAARPVPAEPSRPLSAPGAPLGRRAQGLLRFVLEAGAGERNNRLYWAALRVHENGHQVPAVTAALLDAALHVGLSEREARATVASAARRAGGQR